MKDSDRSRSRKREKGRKGEVTVDDASRKYSELIRKRKKREDDPIGQGTDAPPETKDERRARKKAKRELRRLEVEGSDAHASSAFDDRDLSGEADQQSHESTMEDDEAKAEMEEVDILLENTEHDTATSAQEVLRERKTRKQVDNFNAYGLPHWLANPLVVSPEISKTDESSIYNPKWNLSKHSLSRLSEANITHLFPVQSTVFPKLMQTRYSSASIPPGDVCVSAPTGSGKTLAYALPIVEAIVDRVIPRIRALVVLPTRDLASQVKTVFDMLLRGTDIRTLLVTGQTPFAAEQAQLVTQNPAEVFTERGGSSKVDILIATPGRLMDHLKGTTGFTLRHLRFLVVDEADRLLNQSYQDWLKQVLEGASDTPVIEPPGGGTGWERLGFQIDDLGLPIHQSTTYRPSHEKVTQRCPSRSNIRHRTPLQKLLFSATLTRNPAKISALHLYEPCYISVASGTTPVASGAAEEISSGIETTSAHYVAPATLSEHMMVCPTAGDKPLLLLHLLYNLKFTGVLVFTKSVESAHRLAALLQRFAHHMNHFDATSAALAISSDLRLADRRRLLQQFAVGAVPILVCSDVIARGMDLGESVKVVVNYDVPSNAKAYIHRIGRTARAGRSGTAYTILEEKEVRWFKNETGKIERMNKIAKVKVSRESLDSLVEAYQKSLEDLGKWVSGEAHVDDAEYEHADAPRHNAASDSNYSNDGEELQYDRDEREVQAETHKHGLKANRSGAKTVVCAEALARISSALADTVNYLNNHRPDDTQFY
ncbi:ATP-dependent RNA helicase dbp6 [Gaertneriomyces sp. JEL0708]|nr:ATP-dependent RNA helicase dbp6 [Gaertneriomyces sp. JEL0708]